MDNRPTVKSDWQTVKKKLHGLWPNIATKNLTPDMEALWIKMLGDCSVEAVIVVLEILAGSSPYFPKPFEVMKRLQPEKVQHRAEIHDRREEYQAIRNEIDKVNNFIAKVSEQEQKKAATIIIANNPVKARALSRMPLNHPGWKAMIYRLLAEGIMDIEDDGIEL